MFSAVRRASGPVFLFFAPGHFFSDTEGVGYLFMFCAPGLDFGGIEGVGSRFHVLHARTHFWPYRGRRLPFSCFARSHTFSAVARASGPVFMFCAPGLVFDGIEGVESRYHVLRSRTRFRHYRGRRVPFSCFARVPFHVLRAQTRFRRYRGRRVPFSCIARPDSFSTVPRASGLVFMFCAPGLIFGGTEGVGSLFHVLCPQTHFRRYRGRRVPFSCFVPPDSFSVVPRASSTVFMFCATRLVFGGTKGVPSRFHVLRARTRFGRYRGCRVPFSSFARPN
jgi:hypothetical protein